MSSYSSNKDMTLKGEKTLLSIPATFLGILALTAAILLLFWNESRNRRDTEQLQQAAAGMSPFSDMPQNQEPVPGQLYWVSDELTSADLLTDPQFGITVRGLKMKRRVETYQWVEEPARVNTYAHALAYEKEYTYSKVWREGLIDSRSFKRREEHLNPMKIPVDGLVIQSEKVYAGSYPVSSRLLASADNYMPYIPEHLDSETPSLPAGVLYIGEGSPENPKIGDTKVWWEVVPEGTYSLLSTYKEGMLEPYEAKPGQQIGIVMPGVVTKKVMLNHLKDNQKLLTWYLRALGTILCLFALYLFKLARSRQRLASSPYAIG
ncbi:TMEM43 family protein [Roseivirga sp. BDSF3-8]|uniref:TMEM43 family protein n=1 Tax=Roseivirga sp. BDSF3-8 TaxID=3241598 RepID=UPI003531B87B